MAVLALTSAGVAWAEPANITAAKNEAAALQAQIDDLEEQLDAAVEEYNYAKSKLAEITSAIQDTQKKLTKAERDLEVVGAQYTQRIVSIYKQGQLSMLDVLADSTSFSDLVTRFGLLERVSKQDSELFAQVSAYCDEVATRKAELAQQLAEQEKLTAQAEAAKQTVAKRLAASEKALAGKEAEIAKLEKEEAIRQAALKAAAEEAARKAAAEKAAAEKAAAEKAAAARAAAARESNNSSSSDTGGSSGGSSSGSASVPESASSSEVVSIALRYIGCPYVWAGSSPSGFDCSGFVMYVYAKVGVSLPHSSQMQIGCGRSVSSSELRAGDLVFFGSPIHHVGIYIGDGQMVHAAGVGKGVRIDSVWRSNYAGACRIIG